MTRRDGGMFARARGALGRTLRGPLDARAVILMYHRVCELETDPWGLCVAPSRFAEHLEVVRAEYAPVPLDRLTGASARLPRRAVAVTFDDGYADVLHEAAPLLERRDVPATAFVVSGAVGAGREYWSDELERLLLGPGTLPRTLALRVAGAELRWDLGEDAAYTEEAWARHRGWRAWGGREVTARHAAYKGLWTALRQVPDLERRAALEELRRWAGAGAAGRPSHRALEAEEVAALAAGGLVEIGAHTVRHSTLSALAEDAQRDEIVGSKRELEAMTGRRVTSFAYPHGMPDDYTPATVALVREAGFARACSAFPGVTRGRTDRFQLPRMNVGDWGGEELARRLAAAFEDVGVGA
jgi:peptidoglycan/xylan/chitin deacetylase (PgdA/CDA1 family)